VLVDNLTGKVAVVTGAAKGLGFSLANALANEGMRVVLADVDEAGLEQAVGQLRDSGAAALGLCTDVSDSKAIERLRDYAFEHFETVHVLCNNAGIGGGGLVSEPVDLAQWNFVFGINLFGAIRGVNAFLPAMLKQGEGHIVNTASRAGLLPLPDLGAYVPSKFALVAYSEMLQAELARSEAGVGVTVLTPSGLRTPMLLDSFAAMEKMAAEDPALAEYGQALLANAVEPDDFARLVVRAIKEDSLYVNSHVATLDLVQKRVDRMLADTNKIGTVA
jgi:NAD(P)-dependent dehydrogenase (short-subunit alcohol dehydrogenase family)